MGVISEDSQNMHILNHEQRLKVTFFHNTSSPRVLCAKGAFGSRGRNSQNEKQGWTVVIPSLPQSIEKTISMLKAPKIKYTSCY